jgi:ribonuclease G
MSKEMIVSVNGREKKIAILENGKVTEFYIERGEENSGVAGNVYKGRVMRVLPGMQSAFVDIGLERDAFLYVSDFFDEEEEIERIVTEKGGKKAPTEEAKREARDQVERQRLEREKHMDGAQEIAEPIAESGVSLDVEPSLVESEPERTERPKRGRGRGRKETEEQAEPPFKPLDEDDVELELELTSVVEAPVFEIDASGFERIGDDEDPGEMLKDARMQEAIVNRVRAAEFDMETTAEAAVGSLLSDVTSDTGFERIADEDESPAPAKKGRSKAKAEPKSKSGSSKTSAKENPAKKTSSRSKKKASDDADSTTLEDSQASVSTDTGDIAEMAVRRGGRGRRRGGKGKSKDSPENGEGNGDEHSSDAPDAPENEASESAPVQAETESAPVEEPDSSQPEGESRSGDRERGGRGRGRGGRDRERNDRGEAPSGERGDRPSGDRADRPSGDRGDRPSGGDRGGRGDRPSGDRGGRRERPPQPAISDLLREGQEILVQIAKEPIAKKGARITSHIALPGRYLVYMPTIELLGVSR